MSLGSGMSSYVRSRRARSASFIAVLTLVLGGLVGSVAPASASAATSEGWLHTSGSSVVTATGAPFTIKAVNWFGLETSNCAPHGLWQVSLNSVLDRMHSWGFNTIRMPYSNQCIEGAAPNSIDYTLNPGLRGKSALGIMDAVVAAAKARGMRVILDQHRPDYNSQSPLWYTDQYPETTWISDWVMLATRYKSNPAVIGADLHNEPAGNACWGCGDPALDWSTAAVRGGNAVLGANPHLLIIVEGVENQGGSAGSTWWGGGLADVAAHPIGLSVAHQLVFSVHDYPSSVYAQKWFSASNYPANLPAVWNTNFGYLQRAGTAPVFIGEFGTRLETTSDQQWLTTLVKYIHSYGFGFGFWSYNPDSGDTGGLVADDWTTPETAKLTALKPLLGASATAASVGTATPSAAPTNSTPTPTPSTPTPSTPTPSTPTPSTPTPSTPTPSTPIAVSGPALSATWTLESSWAQGYTAQLTLTARRPVTTWTVSWLDSFPHPVTNSWGLSCSTRSGVTSCSGNAWAASLTAGQTVNVGVQAGGSGSAPTAPHLTVTAH